MRYHDFSTENCNDGEGRTPLLTHHSLESEVNQRIAISSDGRIRETTGNIGKKSKDTFN